MQKTRLPKIFIPFTLLALLLILGLALFAYSFEKIKVRLIGQLEEALQKEDMLADVRVSITQGRLGVRIYDLSIVDEQARPKEIFSTRFLFVDLNIFSLLKKELKVQGLYAYRPKLVVTVDRAGEKVNLSDLFSADFIQKITPNRLPRHL